MVEVEPGHQLVLEAEMKVPGKAWLTWRIEPGTASGALQLHQVAFFAPKGLFGRLYWYVMLPFHWLIFRRMAHAIADHAANGEPEPRSVTRVVRAAAGSSATSPSVGTVRRPSRNR